MLDTPIGGDTRIELVVKKTLYSRKTYHETVRDQSLVHINELPRRAKLRWGTQGSEPLR